MSATLAPPSASPPYPDLADPTDARAGEPAIDLVHLARQTDHDSALEDELLDLFDRQSASLLAQASADGAPTRKRAAAAHTLRGSALAVGAGQVARAAQAVETSLECGNTEKPRIDSALAALAAAIGRARAAIAKLRR